MLHYTMLIDIPQWSRCVQCTKIRPFRTAEPVEVVMSSHYITLIFNLAKIIIFVFRNQINKNLRLLVLYLINHD